MMATAQRQLEIRIMGREFRVACPENEERQLMEAVGYVDRKMTEMRDKSKSVGIERIAIMTALAIANEFLTTKVPGGFDVAEIRRRLHSMQSAIDEATADQEKLF